MPVLFTINPDIKESKSLRDIYEITLSYTFFKSSDQETGLEDIEELKKYYPQARHLSDEKLLKE